MSLKLLLATDGSAAAERAIREAVRIARVDGADVLVVSVVTGTQRFATNTNALQDLERASAILGEAGVAAQAKLLKGDPAEAILEAARHFRPDLVVMGTAARTGLERIMAGSVSQRVVAGWTGPVLVTRAEG